MVTHEITQDLHKTVHLKDEIEGYLIGMSNILFNSIIPMAEAFMLVDAKGVGGAAAHANIANMASNFELEVHKPVLAWVHEYLDCVQKFEHINEQAEHDQHAMMFDFHLTTH